jgi:hypothetical protein
MVGLRIEGTGVAGAGGAGAGALPAGGWIGDGTGAELGVVAAGEIETRAAVAADFGLGTAAGGLAVAALSLAGALAAALAGALASFFGPEPAGRGAGLGVLLAFDVVVLPPGLECFFALRGDLLRIRRCRSIWLIQV